MKIYKRKGSPNWYLRQGDTLISLKTTRKVRIPLHSGHPFRSKPATVPEHSGHSPLGA